ncbi:MAG TPA: hypothetical protein VNF74_09820, partial [Terriglobales bacterium]|nr:hypothetical protein [Terriglobales bacterium]
WYACQPTVPGQDGDPHQWGWGMVDHPGPGIVDPKTGLVGNGGYWTQQWTDLGPAPSSCDIDLGCHFFAGFVNLFLNNQPSGALEMGGAYAAVGGSAVVGAYSPQIVAAARGVTQAAGFAMQYLMTNPELIESLSEFASGFNPTSFPAATWWGVAGGAADQLYQHWGGITSWLEGGGR